ncbi:alpha/beta-hydrolase [Calocera cornea HHB12733]|uniref:Alpha/beta-hydrolase n=1 Tax=Calocera cornea HHB12733 TaxID=1353952 RepID=A0A165H0K0_9BASI|nr:alpha/beta-hydrolase [Calocera cornea HHB12733]
MPMSFAWSTAELGVLCPGDDPVCLYYGDTSPDRVSLEPYTTIIALHGTGFNSEIWNPWLQHIPTDVRLIAFNRRGFAGSSPVHQSTEVLPSNPEAYGRYVLDLLAFIKFVVEVLRVPSKSENGSGGIALLGWSKGCAFLTTLLTSLSTDDELPTSLSLPRKTIDPYLAITRSHVKSLVMFEPPGWTVGIPLRGPLFDESLPLADMASTFISGCLQTFPPQYIETVKLSIDDMWSTGHDLQCWNGATLEEREESATKGFDNIPPSIGVAVIYCAGTVIETCIAGAEWMINHCAGRPNTTSRVIPGGNHFVMATDPERFDDAVMSSIRELAASARHSTASAEHLFLSSHL